MNILRAAVSFIALATLACTAPPKSSSTPTAPASTSEAPSSGIQLVGTMQATWDPIHQQLLFSSTPQHSPRSQDPITISQHGGGTCGSGGQPCNTVELVSTNCSSGGGVFQCDVELRSFYLTRSLANVYAQITSVTYQGSPISGYDAINSDTDTIYTPNLSNTHGLWRYSNGATAGYFLSPNDGTNGGNGTACAQGASGPCSATTRTWEFGDPTNLSIVYEIAVWASLSWGSYSFTFGPGTYTPICPAAGGSGTFRSATSVSHLALPFDFTVYEQTYDGVSQPQEINIARNGQMTFGTTLLTTSGDAVSLPSSSAPSPSIFPFWDNLVAGSTSGSGICTQTIGTAPNRMFGVEWYGMDFHSPPGSSLDSGAFLDFEAFLYEGTGQIDLMYQTMTPSSTEATAGREQGNLATVGVQGEGGTAAMADYHNSMGLGYGSGNSWSLVPSP